MNALQTLQPRALHPLACAAVLLLAQTAAAQPASEWPGRYTLSGERDGEPVRAELRIASGEDGRLRLTRVSQPDARAVWTAVAAAGPDGLEAVYTVGRGEGLVHALARLGGVGPAPHRFVARYALQDGAITETVTNTTRLGDEQWSTLRASGPRRAALTIEQVVAALDARARQRPLGRLGAQWHVLRFAHWQLAAADDGRLASTRAENPYDPRQPHVLRLPLGRFGDLAQLYDRLERDVFPALLRAPQTRWSYEASSYHAVATAHLDRVELSEAEGEAARVRARWGARLPADPAAWPALRERYLAMRSNACPTVCLAQMEAVIARGTLLGLHHPDLVAAVQGRLPTLLGCVRQTFTGTLTHNYDMRGYARFGRWAFVGRPLYFRAMDKRLCRVRGADAESCLDAPPYQGENLVLTRISDAAVADFARMGGFGTVDNLPNFPAPGDTIGDEIAKLSGVSRVIAAYWQHRRAGRDAVAEALLRRPFFEQTDTSVGGSLGHWVRKLYGINSRTPYKLFAYDYGFAARYYVRVRRATEGFPSWREAGAAIER